MTISVFVGTSLDGFTIAEAIQADGACYHILDSEKVQRERMRALLAR